MQPEFGRNSRNCGQKAGNTGTGKIEKFFEVLDRFREILPYTAIHDLLAKIIDKTGYGLFISAMPGGAQRQANVEMLVEKARAFEGTSYKGLFNFVRYIEQLKKNMMLIMAKQVS